MAPSDSLIASGPNRIHISLHKNFYISVSHSIVTGHFHSGKCNTLFIISNRIKQRGAQLLNLYTKTRMFLNEKLQTGLLLSISFNRAALR